MIIYHPAEHYRVLELFPLFIDFVIQQLNNDKIGIEKKVLADHKPCRFNILLINDTDLKKELRLGFEYTPVWGWEVPAPIERFHMELSRGCRSYASIRSSRPDDYDKMLELFRACMNYLSRHYPERHANVTKNIDFNSLERSNWKKSKTAIRAEVASDYKLKTAADDLERLRARMFSELEDKYKHQGYEITD